MGRGLSTTLHVARLVNLRRLRAVALAARRRVDTSTEGHETDAELVDLAADPFETPAETHDRLSTLQEALRDRDDRRAVFLTVYTRMTRDVRAVLEADGFENPDWMREYLVTFANYYRRAFLRFERGEYEAVPEPWRIAFARAVAAENLVMQDAVLGINAHINYDLALAVRDVGIDAHRASKYADHRAINDILAKLVDEQQRALGELYAPGIEDVDAVFGPIDESVSHFTMAEAREQAWRVAVVLTDFDFGPVESYARWVLRMTAVGGALFVLSPAIDPETMDALRRVETRDFDLETVLGLLETRFDALEHS